MSLIYNLLIYFYFGFIYSGSLFNKKAQKWINGRKDLFNKISDEIGSGQNIIWIHAASLGEFEQGRPVIEALRQHKPAYKILLTFFSPSGYEVRKSFNQADFIYYLPIDTKLNARKFIGLVNPKIVIFIKYEYWFNYIHELHRHEIPLFIISAILRKDQYFFKWYGGWFRKMLKKITFFFVQDKVSQESLKSIGINNVLISGDTRFDRVYDSAKKVLDIPWVEKFTSGNKVLLLGSSWPPDEALVLLTLKKTEGIKIIIAPHEVHESRIKSIEAKFTEFNPIRYSQISESSFDSSVVLIIDSIGILSGLYRYCDVALIGGGFGTGIHNILEACTFGKPVVFGPNYRKFREAVDMLKIGGAFCVTSDKELFVILDRLLNDKNYYRERSSICSGFIDQNRGATDMVLSKIKDYL